MTLSEFILARVAEDEAREKVAEHDGFERVLRQCAAIRRIVEEYREAAASPDIAHGEAFDTGYAEGLGVAVTALAATWSHHPDYREEWAA
jgi:hypothetical protein